MRKLFGATGIALLIILMGLSDCNVTTYATDIETTEPSLSVIPTQELPKLLTYEELSKLYSYKEDVRISDSAIIEIGYEDAVKIMKVAQAEAGESDPLAIAYVMMIIINRWKDDYWPDTIEEILTQKKQFTVYKSATYEKTVPNANAHYALYLVESGQINIEAEYYESISVENSWQSRNREVEFEYGGHRFYK